MYVLWPRPPDWHEIPVVYVGFLNAIFFTMVYGRGGDRACGPLVAAGVGLYAVGSALSTVSEYQRYVFKRDPKNKGKLMTTGLWAYSMHANYLGDSVLYSGWTLVAAGLDASRLWPWWAPAVTTALFVWMHIPGLDEYLAHRYPKEFPAYAAKTSKFIPGVY